MFSGKGIGTATCMWCLKEEECVQVKFTDGLSGTLCWGDFKKAVKVRVNGASGKGNKDVQTEKP